MGFAPSAPSSPPVPFLVPREAPGAGRGHWLCPLAPAGTPGLCCSSPAPGAAPCSEHFRFWFPGISEKLVYTRELRCQGIKGRGRSCRSGVGQEEYKRQEPRGAPCGAASSRPSSSPLHPRPSLLLLSGSGRLECNPKHHRLILLLLREESKSLPCSKVKVLGRDMPGEPRQGSSWQRVSLVTAASVTKYSGAAQELGGRVNPEKRTWERRSMAGIGTVEKEREAEATKPQESWMKEDFQELIQQVKAMREDLQKGQESNRKMKKMMRAQESKMDKKFQQLCQRIGTLEQEFYGRQGSKQHILQLLGAKMEIEQGVLIESASEDEAMIQMHRQLLSW
ncbi:uncharacterized protein LOC127461281 isoform X2 [Manacus candei]|uniref:uncharacterized protein LOC127461281 isoform X2 n=1 Tax=Manacus candei TaxID=415023 RepID=UPI002226679A|nr:uncharacterized protein LOC127461281 isoform X2 [Manacus candei]